MKIVLAFDSFKGSLSASEVCSLVAKELARINPALEIKECPIADGGEGTLEVLASLPGVEVRNVLVSGPLPQQKLMAKYLYLPEKKSVFIEMAQAAGITHLAKDQLNPWVTTTYGVGEVILDALKLYPEEIFLAVGGSATNDLGTGAAVALGWKFLKEDGSPVSLGAEELLQVKEILAPDQVMPKLTVLCDVNNPLCGSNGASFIYGPQKGASSEDCQQLDLALNHIAELLKNKFQKDIINIPGAGAAGGLAGGALAFFNANLKSGIQVIMDLIGLDRELATADWVLTGEGCFDQQSLSGKVVSGLLSRKMESCKFAVIAGSSKISEQEAQNFGIAKVFSLQKSGMTVAETISATRSLLSEAVQSLTQEFIK